MYKWQMGNNLSLCDLLMSAKRHLPGRENDKDYSTGSKHENLISTWVLRMSYPCKFKI